MSAAPNVSLTLSNQPDNVVLVREALSGIAETVGVDDVELNDIRTAVTEACNNVVLHAYEGQEGPLQLETFIAPAAVEIVVRDHGTGIKPHIRSDHEAALGIGLSIIQALAPRVEFRDVPGGGTEVRMEFATASAHAVVGLERERVRMPDVERSLLASTIALALAPSALAEKVLPRIVCVLAARARFTTDRISDAELVADALVAHARKLSADRQLAMSVRVEPRSLEWRVDPFVDGNATRVSASAALIRDVAPVIEKLTDGHELIHDGDRELLALRMRDRR
jgi:serine/threonine-protein kinase RsbW